MERYPHVFRPLRLGTVEVANRIYMSPHGIALEVPTPGHEAYHVPAAELAHYFAERARGGTGLIFHSTQVGPAARQHNLSSNPGFDESVPSYERVAEMVHEQGAKIMAEVWYASHLLKMWEARGPEAPTLGASAGQHYASPSVRRAIGRDEIRRLAELHAIAARNLRRAGYDGIEVHVSHGAIFEHFLSPRFNQRADQYGGSLENRVRALRETLETIRDAIGADLAVGIRMNADELLADGLTEEGTREILAHLAGLDLLDFVDLDVSVEPDQQHLMTTTYFEPRLHNAARVANVSPAARPLTVLATPGRVTSMAEAERLLAGGSVDMVGLVRGLIAEPELVNRARDGRERRGRTCIAANHCTEGGGGTFGCAINPAAGREERWGAARLVPAPRSMHVAVVGGGPAGLEAARVAATRGHAVTLFERRPELGGSLALWARVPGREHLASFVNWQARELEELGVDVRLGAEVGRDEVVAAAPDVVLVATGSRYSPEGRSGYDPRPVPGWNRPSVLAPESVIDGTARVGGAVVVVDEEGMHTAAGVAEIAAADGADVELVTRRLSPFPALVVNQQLGYVVSRLRRAGVRISTSTWVREIRDDAIVLFDVVTEEEREVSGVRVVLATAREANDDLAGELDGAVPYAYVVGDALAPRSLREATYEGHRFARVIGEHDMPATVGETLFAPVAAMRPAASA